MNCLVCLACSAELSPEETTGICSQCRWGYDAANFAESEALERAWEHEQTEPAEPPEDD